MSTRCLHSFQRLRLERLFLDKLSSLQYTTIGYISCVVAERTVLISYNIDSYRSLIETLTSNIFQDGAVLNVSRPSRYCYIMHGWLTCGSLLSLTGPGIPQCFTVTVTHWHTHCSKQSACVVHSAVARASPLDVIRRPFHSTSWSLASQREDEPWTLTLAPSLRERMKP